MALHLLPHVEALAVNYLLGVDDITGIVGQRVVTVVPKNAQFPLLRLFRLGGIPPLDVLDEAVLQVEAYADTKNPAFHLAQVAQAALLAMVGVYDEGVVSVVRVNRGIGYFPDPFLNDKPRYTCDVAVRARSL